VNDKIGVYAKTHPGQVISVFESWIRIRREVEFSALGEIFVPRDYLESSIPFKW
jgi:hypothetical protein